MKKCLAILLCAVMLFSCAGIFAFADDETPAETVTITFFDEDGSTVIDTVTVPKGTAPVGPANPTKGRADGDPEWEFQGWVDTDGNLWQRNTLPEADKDTYYTAKFVKMYDNEDNLTLMQFLASIFSRINKIFTAISTYLEDLTKSIQNLLK